MTGAVILPEQKDILSQFLDALFSTIKPTTKTKIMNVKPYAIFFAMACLFSACASPLSPIIETQKEQTIGYRVTAPEIKDSANNTFTPAVDYTVPVADLANPLPPKEIPEGSTVEPIKVLSRVSVVNPNWQTGIETVKSANGMLNPTPTAPLVGIGLTLFGYVLTGIAALRNKQTGKALDSVRGALHAAVDGIEKAADAGMLAKDAKGVIQAKAIAAGAEKVLAAVVSDRT
jgi:hypothetical protein